MAITQTDPFGVRKALLSNTFISLIILISHIPQLLLTRKFYCFRPDPNISFKYARQNHLRCPIIGEVSLETSPN